MTTSSPTRTSRAASLPWELRFVRPPYADLQVNHGLPCPDSAGTLGILTLPEVDLTAPLHRVLRAERETGPCPIILDVMAMLGPDGDVDNTSLLPSFLSSFLPSFLPSSAPVERAHPTAVMSDEAGPLRRRDSRLD